MFGYNQFQYFLKLVTVPKRLVISYKPNWLAGLPSALHLNNFYFLALNNNNNKKK